MTTYAEEVAIEHIAYRRQSGMSWTDIGNEAKHLLGVYGLPVPIEISAAWQIERAFATVWEAVRRGMINAQAA